MPKVWTNVALSISEAEWLKAKIQPYELVQDLSASDFESATLVQTFGTVLLCLDYDVWTMMSGTVDVGGNRALQFFLP